MGAAYLRTVGVLFVSGSDTLYKHNLFGIFQTLVVVFEQFVHLQVRHHGCVFSV